MDFADKNATATCKGEGDVPLLAGNTCSAGCNSGYNGTLSLSCGDNGEWAVDTGACIKGKGG
jgi:hypothetical protein